MIGRVVVVGSLNMDLVVHAPHHPQPGETILGSDFQVIAGGKGANQAVCAARLGSPVTMIGRVGADSFGQSLLDTLSREGINTEYVRRDARAPTGVAMITVSRAGQNTIVVASGANGRVSPDDVEAAEAAFDGAAILLVQLECPLPAVTRAIQAAHQHGVLVVLNPAPAQALNATLLAAVDYLIPNQIELGMLAAQPADVDIDRVPAVARSLRAQGVQHVIVTLGEDGVYLLGPAGEQRLAAHSVKVVDTTAAGDAFVGAFAVALARGKPLHEAAAWGNAAGALAVTRAGAQPSLPTLPEFEAFYAQVNEGPA
jgi:ribokinase